MEKQRAEVKEERTTPESSVEMPVHQNDDHFDYNRLYGDLCRKLLNTPVTEILSGANKISPSLASHAVTTESSVQPLQLPTSNIHTGFLQTMTDQLPFGGLYNQTGVFDTYENLRASQASSPTQRIKSEESLAEKGSFYSPTMDLLAETHEPIDIQTLVDEFRVTLERYGVSQRFAARFIMQDTSQGNLSFLMEKGRVKTWDELSPRGRIPYIKMKAWLESKDLQMNTLNMLKYSQDARRNSPKESYNRRERFSMFQLHVLCRLFEEHPNPPMNVRNAVAERLNIPLDRVNVWFQNQRARGFPARRILQQHSGAFTDPEMNTDVEVVKEICRLTKTVSNDKHTLQIPVTTGAFSPTAASTAPLMHSFPDHQTNTTPYLLDPDKKIGNPNISHLAKLHDRELLSSTNDSNRALELPLDLSASKTNDNSSTSNSVAFTGASKRKRGFKPQQIIQRTPVSPKSGNAYQDENSLKRRRLSSFEENMEKQKYNYVIKSENISPNHSVRNASSSKITSTDQNKITNSSLKETPKEFKIKDDKENSMDSIHKDKADILLKAMCASIAMESNVSVVNSDQSAGSVVTLAEPDLD